MSKELLNKIVRAIIQDRSQNEQDIELIASDPDEFTEMVRQITEVQGEIFLAESKGSPVPQEQRDKLDQLVIKAWLVDEVQSSKRN